MAETTPSDPLDDLLGFRVPASSETPAPQFASRREARAAGAPKRPAEATPPRSGRPAPATSRPAKRARRAVARAVHSSSAKQPRKNPLSVLVTMGVVGGMFAVVGLPAYANSGIQSTVAGDDVPAQSLVVSSSAAAITAARDGYRATTPEQLAQMSKDALRAQNNAEYLASGARELGDDYPWPYELTVSQGGGLSPLNYYYRECVDFVAWRLNRDQGYYAEPFKWVWSTLTPTGGNAYQWLYAWQSHGWTVSKTPVVGSVAWFGSNHVSYVKQVLDGGFVLIEEYNFVPGVYSQRTLPITSVEEFLYPPS